MAGLPSAWVRRWAHLVPAGAPVLDLACGAGRHAKYFAARGATVVAVDRDAAALSCLAGIPRILPVHAELEQAPWPFAPPGRFAAVLVTRYLHRPTLPALPALLAPGGVLIYETFALGQETLGKPSNPDFLLRPGELLALAQGATLRVLGYEDGFLEHAQPAFIQRLCAVREMQPVPAAGTVVTPPRRYPLRAEEPIDPSADPLAN